ncbi:MAG: hypothetical protein JHD16_00955 [Solirubrobacteraceae bacterium]|nr:hypothetical protein [Solirubrobacteraceae bacterium]
MAGRFDSSLTRVQPFFEAAFQREGWLAALLSAVPRARALFGEVADRPGDMLPAFLGAHPTGKAPRACFEFGVAPDKRFLRWCACHPERLAWPPGLSYSEQTTRSRRALLYDEPPGRDVAQDEALRHIDANPTTKSGWWRFEGVSQIDCVIQTEKLVITVEGKRTEPLSAATDWYPQRSQLVRNLEAARQLAKGRAWGTLLLSEHPVLDGQPDELAAILDAAAPQLEEAERAELQRAYLGNVTWADACDAVGIDFDALPDTTAGLKPAGSSAAEL